MSPSARPAVQYMLLWEKMYISSPAQINHGASSPHLDPECTAVKMPQIDGLLTLSMSVQRGGDHRAMLTPTLARSVGVRSGDESPSLPQKKTARSICQR